MALGPCVSEKGERGGTEGDGGMTAAHFHLAHMVETEKGEKG
jgi:hypothetical protein